MGAEGNRRGGREEQATEHAFSYKVGTVVSSKGPVKFPAPASQQALQLLHALSFGATHLGAMDMLSGLAHRNGGATAQGDFAAAQGGTFAVAMGASGGLVAAFGSAAYFAMAATAAAGFAIALGARRERREWYPT